MESGGRESDVLSLNSDSEVSTIDEAEEANEHSFASIVTNMRDIQKSISNDRHMTKSKKESIMDSLDRVMIKMVEELASRKVLQARAEEQEKQLSLLRQEVARLKSVQESSSEATMAEANQAGTSAPSVRRASVLLTRLTYAEAAATRAPAEPTRKESVTSRNSKASKASRKPKPKSKRPVLDTAKIVTIMISDKADPTKEEILEAKTKFADAIKPHETGIRIRKLWVIKNTLNVQADTERDAQIFKESGALKEAFKEVTEQLPPNPLIILYNTDATQDDAIFETAFHKQNYSEEYTLTEFREKFKVKFRVGPRMPDCHRVIEVHPELRDKLLKAPRLFVGYRSTRARDYLQVPKCYKCHDYGHVQKYCTSVEQLCGTCGGLTSLARLFSCATPHLRDIPVARHFICATFHLRDISIARHPSCATFHLSDISFARLFSYATFQLRDISSERHPICATSHLRDISFARLFSCATPHLRDNPFARHFICATFRLRDLSVARHLIYGTFHLRDISFARLFSCATFQLRDISSARHPSCATSHLRDFSIARHFI